MQTDGQAPRTVTLSRSSRYVDQAYAGSGLTFPIRSWIIYGWQLAGNLCAWAIAFILILRRSSDPVAAMLALASVPFLDSLYVLWPAMPTLLGLSLYAAILGLNLLTILVFPNGAFTPRWTIWVVPLIIAIALANIVATRVEIVSEFGQYL